MDLTMLAAYAGLVCGYLIMDSPAHQLAVRRLLRNGRFAEMVVVLEKYYTFMNLTNSVSVPPLLLLSPTNILNMLFLFIPNFVHPVRGLCACAHQTDQNHNGVLQAL